VARPGGGPRALVEVLERALDAAVDASWDGLGEGEVLDLVARLGRVGSRVSGVRLDGVAEAERRQAARRVGARSTGSWLQGTGMRAGAAQREVAGLILEAPFTSVAEVAQYHYSFIPAAALVRDRFDSLARIAEVKAPILVLHGERDRVVPVRFGRALFDAAPEPKELWLSRDAGHEDLVRYGAFEAVLDFLRRRVG